jgi:hypothetical protein
MFQKNMLPPSSVTEFGVDGCQSYWVERKCPLYMKVTKIQNSEWPKVLQPSYPINTSSPPGHFGNRLNQIQSAWRWRNNIAPKCHNKFTEHSVITRRPSFGFNTLFWKYNMVGFYWSPWAIPTLVKIQQINGHFNTLRTDIFSSIFIINH